MDYAATAALLAPPRYEPFSLDPPQAGTCEAAYARPWQLGAWKDTDLNPFDDVKLLEREQSTLEWCQTEDGRVTECAACPYGYELPARGPSFAAGAGPLRCRPTAACDKGACTQCVQSALTPWLIGTCDACIEYGCNPDTGRCACNVY